VNNTNDLVMFDHFWPTPLEAEGDMQSDADGSNPEEYCRNRIATVDEDEEDEDEEEEEVEELDDDQE